MAGWPCARRCHRASTATPSSGACVPASTTSACQDRPPATELVRPGQAAPRRLRCGGAVVMPGALRYSRRSEARRGAWRQRRGRIKEFLSKHTPVRLRPLRRRESRESHRSSDQDTRKRTGCPKARGVSGMPKARTPKRSATRRFGRETLAPEGGVERVAELTLECKRDASGRLCAPEPSSANPVLGCRGFDSEIGQAAAPDQRSVFLAQDREVAERELLRARQTGLQPRGRLFGRARPASEIKILRDTTR